MGAREETVQRRKAEEIIGNEFDDLLKKVSEMKELKIKELKWKHGKKRNFLELQKELSETEKKMNNLKNQLKTMVLEIEAEIVDEQQAIEKAAGEIKSRIRDRRNKLIKEVWIGGLSERLKKMVKEIPTIEEFSRNGLKALKVRDENEIKKLPVISPYSY